MRRILVLGCFLLLVLVTGAMAQEEEEPFTLTIMHTNDTHAKHEPFIGANGGVAIQATVVNAIRAEVPNSLLLDAGDRFSGSLYHTVHQGQDQVQVMNALGYDAMALGNHEFDNGDQVLSDFLDGLEFPALSANIDFSASTILADKVAPFTVLEVGGEQIGIIGLTTAEAVEASSPGPELVFDADYAAVTQAAVDELTAQGINKIILVTHLGLDVDATLATEVSGVDVIVGGHTHSLLSNLYAEEPLATPVGAVGEYPIALESASGEPVYVVTASENNVFLGRLDLEFDADGLVASAGGDVIFLSQYIPSDETLAGIVTDLSDEVVLLNETPVTTEAGDLVLADVALVGERTVCRVEECNLGNLIADALRDMTGTQIALMNGGGIRASIDAGEITFGEVLTTMPFNNQVSTFETDGATILAALENGVSGIVLNEAGQVERDGAPGRFPQISGMRFSFDPALEPGSRVTSVEVEQEDGSYAPLDPAATYSVSTLNFIRLGGDGYDMFTENSVNPYDYFGSDYQMFADYLALNTPVAPAVEGRVTIENTEVEPIGE
jgi:5'-nucleotidase / UDP-sugar diphosphatase